MKYTVKKGLTGYVVRYACPGCQIDLRAPLKDADNNEVCTDCGTKYVVPGSAEKKKVMDAVAAKKKQIADQKDQAKAEKERQQRLAAAEKKRQAKSQAAENRQMQLAQEQQRAQLPAPPVPAAPQVLPPLYAAPQSPPPGTWRCPYCQGTTGIYRTSKISGGGWALAIVMFVLLCWPLFWIGFLMKEEHSYCNTCNAQLS